MQLMAYSKVSAPLIDLMYLQSPPCNSCTLMLERTDMSDRYFFSTEDNESRLSNIITSFGSSSL